MRYRLACILAAGSGDRLDFDKPKGFIKIGERPIIEESVESLLRAGIEKVVIVTGYRAEYYRDLQLSYGDQIFLVHNPRYADSGSLYSLWQARNELREPYLLLESDLIYEERALEFLQSDPQADLVLLSSFTGVGDEVYAEVWDGALVNLSKKRQELGPQVVGELVGLCKISLPLHEALISVMNCAAPDNLNLDYESDGLVLCTRSRRVPCSLIPNLVWTEIDDQVQLERAKAIIYPQLRKLR